MQQKFSRCQEEFVDVLGARVHYLHAGSGRPLLLIHGLVGSSTNWRNNIDSLATDASVYAIDLLNTGKSERIAELDPSLEATADRVASIMDALGVAEADIAGHSHGGAVALMLAARHPHRVRSLILFAPANPFCKLPDPMVRLYSSAPGRLLARCAPYVPRPIQLIALGRMYGDPARIAEGCIQGYIDGLRRPGTVEHILSIVRGWFADMAALAAALPQVARVPTLLLWGDRDRAMSAASGVQLNEAMTASELIVVPGGGHVLFEEMPVEANRAMLEWLRRDPATSTPPEQNGAAARSRDALRSASIAAIPRAPVTALLHP